MKVDSYNVCSGGPTSSSYKSIQPECAIREDISWRHKNCPLILESGYSCKNCISLHKILAQNFDYQRNKKSSKIKISPSSPNIKQKIDLLRKKNKVQQKRLHRQERRIQNLTRDLNDSVDKILKLEKSKISDEIDKLKLPKNQVYFMHFLLH